MRMWQRTCLRPKSEGAGVLGEIPTRQTTGPGKRESKREHTVKRKRELGGTRDLPWVFGAWVADWRLEHSPHIGQRPLDDRARAKNPSKPDTTRPKLTHCLRTIGGKLRTETVTLRAPRERRDIVMSEAELPKPTIATSRMAIDSRPRTCRAEGSGG